VLVHLQRKGEDPELHGGRLGAHKQLFKRQRSLFLAQLEPLR